MGWHCGNCSAFTSRGVLVFDEKGRKLREYCKYCNPENFEAFRAPSDKKIYAGPDAMPNMYKRDNEGMYHAKDELIADTAAGWDAGPTELARQRKAATRRTEPLTPEEVEKTRRWAEEVLKPAVEKGGTDAAVAMLNPQ